MSQVKTLFTFLLIILSAANISAQNPVEVLQKTGFRLLELPFEGEMVQVLIRSGEGQEDSKKPILLFCEGSLPQPAIKYSAEHIYDVVPFDPADFEEDYHIVLINKPGIPLTGSKEALGDSFIYRDSAGFVPDTFNLRDHAAYYVRRNRAILEKLQGKSWADPDVLVVAGHSQGSNVAVRLAAAFPAVTHLIYSGGSPLGRILRTISQLRNSPDGGRKYIQEQLDFWSESVANRSDSLPVARGRISHRHFYSFSASQLQELISLEIPVLVTYGTKDHNCYMNDFLQVHTRELGRKNFTFIDYQDKEHNYFDVLPDGSADHSTYHWTAVGRDWLAWLKEH